MDHTFTISETLYLKLQHYLQLYNLNNIEQLLEVWLIAEEEKRLRQETVRQIDTLRQTLFQRYGQMPDSTQLLRTDRSR